MQSGNPQTICPSRPQIVKYLKFKEKEGADDSSSEADISPHVYNYF